MDRPGVKFACTSAKRHTLNEYADVDPLELCIIHKDGGENRDLLFGEQRGSRHSRSPPIDIPGNSPDHAFRPIGHMEDDLILSLCRRVRALEQQVETVKRQLNEQSLMLQTSQHRHVGCATCCGCCGCCGC